jgi:hypothetical protein
MPHRIHVLSITVLSMAAVVFSSHARADTWYVANDGVDGSGCGATTSPCRSIGQATANASSGDTIIVGPGIYGELNGSGVLGDAPGEENPATFSPFCGCVVGFEKPVNVMSSRGAASTIIDGRGLSAIQTVAILSSGMLFGKPGKGFTVYATATPVSTGIGIDGTNVKVGGNQVIEGKAPAGGVGIKTIDNDAEIVSIEGNQVIGWGEGIQAFSSGKTIRKNVVSAAGNGIVAGGMSVVAGNVAVDNRGGFVLSGATTAVSNAAIGNRLDGFLITGVFTGTFEKNNIVGNGDSGLGNCGLRTAPSSVLSLPNNYWGAPTGPGPNPADQTCGGTTMVTPFATNAFKIRTVVKP